MTDSVLEDSVASERDRALNFFEVGFKDIGASQDIKIID